LGKVKTLLFKKSSGNFEIMSWRSQWRRFDHACKSSFLDCERIPVYARAGRVNKSMPIYKLTKSILVSSN